MRTRWSRGYDPRYGDPYAYRGWGRGPRYGAGDNCLRNACLLETGCCIGEALGDNCLIAGLLLLPQFVSAAVTTGRRAERTGRQSARLAEGLVGAIRVYQREISAHRRPCCRFTPSCSAYAVGALQTHGVRRGLILAARRLLRCRPGGARGADPVPAPTAA